MNSPHHSNEWDKHPDPTPDALDAGKVIESPEAAIAFRLSRLLREAQVDVMRLCPDDPRKEMALRHLDSAVRLCLDVCEQKPERQ